MINDFIKIIKIIPILFLVFSFNLSAQQNSCKCNIDVLKDLYSVGQFITLKNNLKCCLFSKGKLSLNDSNRIHELLALTAIAEDSISLANSYLKKILETNSNYSQENQNLVFQDLFYRVKKENLKVVVTSVSKRPEDIKTAPATVEIIEAKDIIARGYVDLIDLLSDVAGFEISKTYSMNYANVYQLGFRQESTERTLLMIDGVEENDLWSNFAYISRQYPISNIKAVEILYGPSATMYGPRAFLGTINIITYSPKEEAGNYFENEKLEKGSSIYFNGNFSRGSFNTYDADFTLGNSKKDKQIYFQVTGRYFTSDEHDMSSEPFFNYDPADLLNFEYEHLGRTFDSNQQALEYERVNNLNQQPTFYDVIGDRLKISEIGIKNAIYADSLAYQEKVNGNFLSYSNHTENYFFGAKISFKDLLIGFRGWMRAEGLNNMQDLDVAPSRNGSIWSPSNQTIYLKYNNTLNENFSFSLQSSLKNHTLGRKTNRVNFIPFGNPNSLLSIKDLVNYSSLDSPDEIQMNHGWRNQFYYYQTLQGRTEIRLYYNSKNLNIAFGTDHRMTSSQGDYYLHKNFQTDFSDEAAYLTNLDSAYAMELGKPFGSKNNSYRLNETGSFLQANYILDERIHLNGGLRFDRQMIRSKLAYRILQPRLGITFTTDRITIKSNYSKGFQNVSLYNKFSTGGNRIPSPNLKPEEIQYLDVSILGNDESDKFNWNITGFAYEVENSIGTQETKTGNSQNINDGSYLIYGGMMNVKYRTKFLRFDLNGTYLNPFEASQNKSFRNFISTELDSDDKTSEDLLRIGDIASYRANVGVTGFVNTKLFNTSLNVRVNYVSQKSVGPTTTQKLNLGLNNSNHIPEYLVINSNLIIGFEKIPSLKLALSANNLFNKLYYHPGVRSASGSFDLNTRTVGQSYEQWTRSSLSGKNVPYAPQRGRYFNLKIMMDL